MSWLPEGPFYFDADQRSDLDESLRLAGQVLARTREEVPHAVEVQVESIDRPSADLIRVEAVILVETDSQ